MVGLLVRAQSVYHPNIILLYVWCFIRLPLSCLDISDLVNQSYLVHHPYFALRPLVNIRLK